MFSQTFNHSKTFLTRQPKRQQQGPADQVQPEIPSEREKSEDSSESPGMVTTRRQSLSLHSDEVRPEVNSNVARSGRKKRKSAGSTKSPNGGKKRRVEAENSDEDLGNGEATPLKKVEDEAVSEGNMMAENTEVGSIGNGANSSAVEVQEALDAASEVDDSIVPGEVQPKRGKKSRDMKKVINGGEKTVSQPNGHSNLIPPKRQHVRFGSEEPQPVPLHNDASTAPKPTPNEIAPLPSSNLNDSDDDEEAPESIHNVSELKRVQAESLKAAQAQESEKQLLRRKRREKDVRLKDQAEAKQRNRRIPAETEGKDESDGEPSSTVNAEYRLPALLPDSILNAIPQKQRFNPGPEPSEQSKRHKKPLTHSPKPPKDISIGKTTIRVSKIDREVLPSSLAPKTSSSSSRNVRESWLRSLRGVTDGTTRRSPAKFVRK